MVALRFEVFLVNLNPTVGREMQKARPCVVVSPDEMNRNIATVTIAPMTTMRRNYPTRVNLRFEGKEGQIILDQIRTVDKRRLLRKLGVIDKKAASETLAVLQEMFAE
ncbi:MAG: type II toxin-antitoxin system PemK/MazF family toxin [Anaerolineales bacterium]|nr:type II toxin-antitoxin system PemK/MazF family toxin [Anaerolineales bacterium]